MRCPYCRDNQNRVIDSREAEAGRAIRRRRACRTCGQRFTTFETIERRSSMLVIKQDGKRTPYDREKILAGLEKACYKRPVSAEQLRLTVDRIEDDLFRRGLAEVDSTEIGWLCVEALQGLDQVACIRFASVYLNLSDMNQVLDQVQEIRDSGGPGSSKDQGQLF